MLSRYVGTFCWGLVDIHAAINWPYELFLFHLFVKCQCSRINYMGLRKQTAWYNYHYYYLASPCLPPTCLFWTLLTQFFSEKKQKSYFFFPYSMLKLEFIVIEMESPMIDRLECCFSSVYPLPCVQDSKSWQPFSDPWMRTSEHIDNWALCNSSHLVRPVVYMLMLDSVTPASQTHFLLRCYLCAVGAILILTLMNFDKNVNCDDVLSRTSVTSWYLLNLVSQQRSIDHKTFFPVPSGELWAETKLVSDLQSSFTLELQGSLLQKLVICFELSLSRGTSSFVPGCYVYVTAVSERELKMWVVHFLIYSLCVRFHYVKWISQKDWNTIKDTIHSKTRDVSLLELFEPSIKI